jgi:hypothetical protein
MKDAQAVGSALLTEPTGRRAGLHKDLKGVRGSTISFNGRPHKFHWPHEISETSRDTFIRDLV